MNVVRRFNPLVSAKRFVLFALIVLVVISVATMLAKPTYAARFTNRSLKINSGVIDDVTTYTVNFGFPSANSIGSVQMEFCDDPVPDEPCTQVPGLDVSGVTLASQSGETGFAITQQTTNKLVLSRTPSVTGLQNNTYVFNNAKNPSVAEITFYIRLTSYASTNASGSFIDYGGVASVVTRSVNIQTQVPPVLGFCVSLVLQEFDCSSSSIVGGNFQDFGELTPDQTYTTQSQIIARTNARDGYAVSVYGIGVTAGNNIIPSLDQPTPNAAGNSQFGINLVANSTPAIGQSQDGPGFDATINPDYAISDKFMYKNGDTLLTVPGVSDFKRYTVSYILNRSPSQAPGKYGVTLTYICTGFF